MAIRSRRCGCDCNNSTVAASGLVGATGVVSARSCCQSYSDVPCQYAVMFECYNDWPLWTRDDTCGTDVFGDGILRTPYYVPQNYDSPYGPTDCSGPPSPLGLTFPVVGLVKDCPTDIDGSCSYTNKLYFAPNKVASDYTTMSPSIISNIKPNAAQNTFPPISKSGSDPIQFIEAQYEIDTPATGVINEYIKSLCNHGDMFGSYNDSSHMTLWRLSIGSGTVALEWEVDEVLNAMPRFGATVVSGVITGSGNTGVSPYRPRYVAEDTWNVWGRNSMDLQNPEDWPNLKRRICVAALNRGEVNLRCDSHTDQCNCCDAGGDAANVTFTVTGCSGIAGTYGGTMVRIRNSGDLEAGVTIPGSAPCGIFWGTFGGTGDICAISGVNWSNQLGLSIYCDGSNYNVIPYCYQSDSGVYVQQTAATVNTETCGCYGVDLDFTLPSDLDCCCPSAETICSECVSDCINASVPTFTFDNGSCVAYYPGGTVQLNALAGEPAGTCIYYGTDETSDYLLTVYLYYSSSFPTNPWYMSLNLYSKINSCGTGSFGSAFNRSSCEETFTFGTFFNITPSVFYITTTAC